MAFLERNANRGSISTAAYEIDNSLKLDSVNSEYLYIHRDASGSDWNRLLWTASMWVKHIPTENSTTAPKERMFGAADAQSDFDIRFRGQPIGFRNNSDVDGVAELRTEAYYRDPSAWYHVVAVWDTANGTAGNRMRLYVNGEEVTNFSTDTQPAQNEKSTWGKKNDGSDGNVAHTIGAYYNASSGFAQGFNGYMAEIHWVEGAALAPTEFGEFDSASGIWKPKEAAVTYGTNGFYLNFDDSSALGADSSGNSNNWNLNNIAAADQATDTPTNNFCTLNPLYALTYPSAIREGGTKSLALDTVSQWQSAKGSMAVNNGKWYWEHSGFTEMNTFIGIQSADANTTYGVPYSWNLPLNDNQFYIVDPNARTEGFSTSKATSDVWAIALNMDDGQISFYRNGTQQNSTVSIDGLIGNGPYVAIISQYASATNASTNFGGYNSGKAISSAATDENDYGTFEYAPPSGYYSLCSKNLAEYG